MRVNITHGETKTGVFRKTNHHTVTVSVQFSEEETHIVKSKKLGDEVIVERAVPSDRDPAKFVGMEHIFNLTIARLLKGPDTYAFSTPFEAKEYEATLKEMLPKVKVFIAENEGVQEKSSSFEL